jgi:hypothetical protein
VRLQSQELKSSILHRIFCKTILLEVKNTSEEINVPARLQEIGQKIGEYKDIVVNEFKDMEVDVKNWTFALGKTEEEYTLEVNLKLAIKPKKKQE